MDKSHIIKKLNNIKPVKDRKASTLYDDIKTCFFCKEPFKECDTIIPGKGLIIGPMDVVKYKNHFWHHGCVFDYIKINTS